MVSNIRVFFIFIVTKYKNRVVACFQTRPGRMPVASKYFVFTGLKRTQSAQISSYSVSISLHRHSKIEYIYISIYFANSIYI